MRYKRATAPECVPVRARRVDFPLGVEVSYTHHGQMTPDMVEWLDSTWALRITSSVDSTKKALEPFDVDTWNSSRAYRALVLRLARKALRGNAAA